METLNNFLVKPGRAFSELFILLISPYFLALVVVLIVIAFLPHISKYQIKLVDSHWISKDYAHSYYHDLNQDSLSEYILSFNSNDGRHAIKIMSHDMRTINQWNFDGKCPARGDRVFFGDYDQNGYDEIYVFSQTKDSVLLHIFEPLAENGMEETNILLGIISGKYNDSIDFSICPEKLIDMDNDGYKDLVFNIYAGFSIQPRKLYIYNIRQRSLLSSPKSGTVLHHLKFADLDRDGKIEILGNTAAPGNIEEEMHIPYRDSSSWLMVFDHQLRFKFAPIEFPGFRSYILTQPLVFKDSSFIAFIYFTEGMNPDSSHLSIYNHRGRLIKKSILPESNLSFIPLIDEGQERYYFGSGNMKIYELKRDLKLHEVKQIELTTTNVDIIMDIDLDGQQEIIFDKDYCEDFTIMRKGFKDAVSFQMEAPPPVYCRLFSIKKNREYNPQLYFQLGAKCCLFDYLDNPIYRLRWINFAAIYLFLLGFIFIIRWLYRMQIEKQARITKRIAELQFNSISNQINLHFIFNAMNSITAAIYKENKEEAYRFGNRFSQLMREVLLSAERIGRPLNKELEFVTHYLELEKFRHKNVFDYQINMQEGIDSEMEVPKMIIQAFAENAVKHGLSQIEKDGLLKISIFQEDLNLHVVIEDNGPGRQKAKETRNEGTGKGLLIAKQMFGLYEKLKNKKISFRMEDVEPHGTRVVIEMQL